MDSVTEKAIRAGVSAALEKTDAESRHRFRVNNLVYYVVTPVLIFLLAMGSYNSYESRQISQRTADNANNTQQLSQTVCSALRDLQVTLSQRTTTNAQDRQDTKQLFKAISTIVDPKYRPEFDKYFQQTMQHAQYLRNHPYKAIPHC